MPGRKEGKERKKMEKKGNITWCHSVHLTVQFSVKPPGLGAGILQVWLQSLCLRQRWVPAAAPPACGSFSRLIQQQRGPERNHVHSISFKDSPSQRGSFCSVIKCLKAKYKRGWLPYKFQLTPRDLKVTSKPLHAHVWTWISLKRLLMLLTVSTNYTKTSAETFQHYHLKRSLTVD